eukprot:11742341-Ditylum_brightwellii.AAC.1
MYARKSTYRHTRSVFGPPHPTGLVGPKTELVCLTHIDFILATWGAGGGKEESKGTAYQKR